jgi:hypothetical protein
VLPLVGELPMRFLDNASIVALANLALVESIASPN